MCNCIKQLVHTGCIERITYVDTLGRIQDNGYFILAKSGKKVLPNCERIKYCPMCGNKIED